ncbi:MAG: hypothetical protein ACRDAS_11925 [Cetobacterium sp.]
MIKDLDSFIKELNGVDSFNTIIINYEKIDGIYINRDFKEFQILKNYNPYKFYLFNDEKMIYGIKLDQNEYFIEEIKKESFEANPSEEFMFIDEKEITKVSGHSYEKRIKFRKGMIGNSEKIQFISLEG